MRLRLPQQPKKKGRSRPPSIEYRQKAFDRITNDIGVYAICDLNAVPLYVGQSTDGIRNRVRRHLTSARSDVIANRQVDIWEAAYVWAWPAPLADIAGLEAVMFHRFNAQSPLMNGSIPLLPSTVPPAREPAQIIQIMSDEEIAARRQPAARLPRQIEHYGRLVDHFLTVKDSRQISLSMHAHFSRLSRYHHEFLQIVGPAPTGSADAEQDENEGGTGE